MKFFFLLENNDTILSFLFLFTLVKLESRSGFKDLTGEILFEDCTRFVSGEFKGMKPVGRHALKRVFKKRFEAMSTLARTSNGKWCAFSLHNVLCDLC